MNDREEEEGEVDNDNDEGKIVFDGVDLEKPETMLLLTTMLHSIVIYDTNKDGAIIDFIIIRCLCLRRVGSFCVRID